MIDDDLPLPPPSTALEKYVAKQNYLLEHILSSIKSNAEVTFRIEDQVASLVSVSHDGRGDSRVAVEISRTVSDEVEAISKEQRRIRKVLVDLLIKLETSTVALSQGDIKTKEQLAEMTKRLDESGVFDTPSGEEMALERSRREGLEEKAERTIGKVAIGVLRHWKHAIGPTLAAGATYLWHLFHR